MTLCWQCQGWAQWDNFEFGSCHILAKPTKPIDGKPAWSFPTRRADSSCDNFKPEPNNDRLNRRIGMVRMLEAEKRS